MQRSPTLVDLAQALFRQGAGRKADGISGKPALEGAFNINALGGNSFIWKFKHNIIHHTYTNVDGVDDDIFKPPFLRMSPNQPYNRFHKNQHKYMLLLYGVSTLFWVFFILI